jgi:hypothetical protein
MFERSSRTFRSRSIAPEFHLAGKRYRHALKTSDESVTNSVIGGVERTIMLIEQQALQIPEGADVGAFILSGGQVAKPLVAETPDEPHVLRHGDFSTWLYCFSHSSTLQFFSSLALRSH